MIEPQTSLERFSERLTNWIGSTSSILVHTMLFVGVFALREFGVGMDEILLILTTAVSLEAIYLAIFIQMTVNRNTQSLAGVEEDIEDISEDVEDISEDVEDLGEDIEELSKDVDELSEDVDEIQEEDAEDERQDLRTRSAIDNIEVSLQKLVGEIEALKQSIRKD